MRVIALQLGYDNITLRNTGDEFDMPETIFDGGAEHWFEPVDAAEKEKAAAARKAVRKPEVAAVEPARQQADKQATDEKTAKEQGKKS